MPISEVHVGRSYPPTAPYEVSAAKIAEFARAIGDENPVYAGSEPVAPPTFAAMVSALSWESLFSDPDLEIALARVVHTDQRFEYQRPLRAGDVVTAELRIDKVRARAGAEFISTSVRVETAAGELVCTASSTFLHAREVQ